jgi:hypothetical protein
LASASKNGSAAALAIETGQLSRVSDG